MNPLEKYLMEKTANAGRVAGAFEAMGKGVRAAGEIGKGVVDHVKKNPVGAVAEGAVGAGVAYGANKLLGKGKKKDDEEKTAGLMDLLGKAKEPALNAAAGAAGLGAAGAGVAAVSFGAQKLYDAITKRRDFRLMLEHNPDLHEHLERDPKFFNQAYSSLRSVNPQFSKEPLIAGNYMRQMMDAPMSAGGKIELALQGAHQGHGAGGVGDLALKGMFEGAKSGLNKDHAPTDPLAREKAWLDERRTKERMQKYMEPPPFQGGGSTQGSFGF
jgi:hypothetical protein